MSSGFKASQAPIKGARPKNEEEILKLALTEDNIAQCKTMYRNKKNDLTSTEMIR